MFERKQQNLLVNIFLRLVCFQHDFILHNIT